MISAGTAGASAVALLSSKGMASPLERDSQQSYWQYESQPLR
jgi:hypothetical protein